jgi:hypothetical protein
MSSSADYHVRFDYYTLLAVYFRHLHVLFVYSLVNPGDVFAAMHGSCINKILEAHLDMYPSPDYSICSLCSFIFIFTLDPHA